MTAHLYLVNRTIEKELGRIDSRIRIPVQSQEINLRRTAIDCTLNVPVFIQQQAWSVGILIGVQEDVGPVVFVVTVEISMLVSPPSEQDRRGCDILSGTSIRVQFQNIRTCAFGEVEWSFLRSHCDCLKGFGRDWDGKREGTGWYEINLDGVAVGNIP